MERETHTHQQTLLSRFYAASDQEATRVAEEIVTDALHPVRICLQHRNIHGDNLEELCQDVRVRLYQALQNSRGAENNHFDAYTGYAITIAQNLCIDKGRQESRQPNQQSIEALTTDPQHNPDSILPPAPDNVEKEALANIADRYWQQTVWPLVFDLPLPQRVALLLNMDKDELLLLAGTKAQVARCLEMELAEFLPLWRELGVSFSDRVIGARLGFAEDAAQQKVANLRKSARERINRQLSKRKQ